MPSSSNPSSDPMPFGFLLKLGNDLVLVMIPEGSAIDFGDGEPILLQNMN